MASYASLMLFFPGTVLERLWKLNPDAHRHLIVMANPSVPCSYCLPPPAAPVSAGAASSLGMALATVDLGTQVVGCFASLLRSIWLPGLIGLLIGGALLL
jgi:hypothetical protein